MKNSYTLKFCISYFIKCKTIKCNCFNNFLSLCVPNVIATWSKFNSNNVFHIFIISSKYGLFLCPNLDIFTIAIILFGTIMMVQIMTLVAKHNDEICFQNSYDSKSILIPIWLWLPYMYCVTDSPHSITIERHTFLINAIKLKRKISFPHCDKFFNTWIVYSL